MTVDYAKASPTDMCIVVNVANRGPDTATLDVLPTLWFRNTWSWGLPGRDQKPVLHGGDGRLVGEHWVLGQIVLQGEGDPTVLCCDNETNTQRLWGLPGRSEYPKDGINDHVVDGADTVNPDMTGTKGALHYRLTVPAGGEMWIRLRLTLTSPPPGDEAAPLLDLGRDFDKVIAARRTEADAYFTQLTPKGASREEAAVLRKAIAG
ncbi:hypothetical protein Pflav_048610 [Phytohabitans flavus]|uniref:Uncharacterized protein n=1 Tax=Phytohabitans flavus TaxID=1076124 RepID=A0A6F8XXJ1_9ACTN|nr:hypothetical protein Pflav_048610 [Phytohabitans flavus]